MFKAELSNPNILKSSFDAISNIVEEVQLQTDNDGIRLNALDKNHITFVHLELKKFLFDEYESTEPAKINVDTTELFKILKRAKNDDRVLLSLDDNNLIITLEGEASRTFKIRLIDLEYDENTPPELDYPTSFEVPFNLLKDSSTDIGIYSDKIKLSVDENNFTIKGDGEFGSVDIEYLHGESIGDTVESVFSLDKVKEMLRADKISTMAKIKLGDNRPMSLSLDMEDGELSFLLAPRIEEDTDV